jgi:predicted PurR-regulated permease PerM
VALASLAYEVYITLRWLVVTRIPQVVGNAVNAATNYLVGQLNNLGSFLRGLIDGLSAWIQQQVKRIDTFVDNVIRWVTKQFNEIIATLTWVYRTVVALLTDPRRLAVWAIDAIIGEAVRWADRNADRLFILVRQRSIHYTLQFADRIESMLSRLL